MLCIFKGPTPSNLIAGDVQKAVEGQVCACEHDPTVQERQDVCYRLQLVTERPAGKKIRLGDGTIGEILEEEVTRVAGKKRMSGTRKVLFSSALSGLTLADFPKSFSFGNGVTCNSMVTLRDGTIRCLSWAVFPDTQEATVNTKFETLRQLMEG